MTTPQPSPRDIEQADKLTAEWMNVYGPRGAEYMKALIAQALAQREAEVRAEYAAFADENGEPRNIVGNLPVSKDGAIVMPGQFVYVGGQRFMLTLDYTIPVAVPNDNGGWRDMHIGECFAFRDAALAARKEGE
jgi:hypothetical protein